MQYMRYGKDGPEISRLGFGCMRLPLRKPGAYSAVNYAKTRRCIRAALEAGVNFFDSHAGYHGGNSELALGKALKGWKGRVVIQTKQPWYNDQPIEFFEKLLDETLQKLGVDCLDYLFHHYMMMDNWKKRGKLFLKFTDQALRRGLIRHRGFSSHETNENIREFIDTGEFSAMLVPHNWLNPIFQDTIAYAAGRGMGVSIMNPVGGGFLSTTTPQVLRLLPGAKTAAEIGIRYALATPGVVCALSGMNEMEQVKENVAVASRKAPMTPMQWTRIRAKLKDVEAKTMAFCTACGYCMPCPNLVDIPGNFQALNRVRFFGQLRLAKVEYAGLKKDKAGDKSAEACKRCGRCEPKCPNKVPIIKTLAKVAATLE